MRLSCKSLSESSLSLLEKLRSESLLAKVPGKIWYVTFFLFNYEFFYCEFPECLFLPVLPRWLSHHSAFTGSFAQINGVWWWQILYPNITISGHVGTRHRALQQNQEWYQQCAEQRDTSRNWKCGPFQLFFHSTTHLTVCRARCFISFNLWAATFPILHLGRASEHCVLCSASSTTKRVCECQFFFLMLCLRKQKSQQCSL